MHNIDIKKYSFIKCCTEILCKNILQNYYINLNC